MKDISTFYDAWWFLAEHPAFRHLKDGEPDVIPGFMGNLSVEVQRVDPETRDYSDAPDAVTAVWLEAGPWTTLPQEDNPAGPITRDTYDEIGSHDTRLDCGGATYEEAIVKMAALVLEHYGDYEEDDE